MPKTQPTKYSIASAIELLQKKVDAAEKKDWAIIGRIKKLKKQLADMETEEENEKKMYEATS